MKKILKIFLVISVLTITTLFAFPYFYKDKIVAFVKEDLNNTLNATVDFKDVNLSMFRSFPNFNLELNQLDIFGIDTFKNIKLLDVNHMNITLDIKSVISGDEILVKKIGIKDAVMRILITEDGKANYDIIKKTDKESEPSTFNIDLKSYFIKNSTIYYLDKSLNFSAEIKNLNHEGSGKLTDKIYELNTKSTADSLTLTYDNIKYLNKVKAEVLTDFDISGDFSKYTLKNTKAKINDLPIFANGFVELKENEILMDINYKTENADIVQLLSLVPKEYMPDLKDVQTTGLAKLTGFVKGRNTETELPGFKLLIDVQNASIQYPDLPEKIKNINLLTDVDFKGGSDLNTMIVDLPKIQFDVAGSSVYGNLSLKQPMTQPYITAAFRSKMDFSQLKKAVKISQIKEITGRMDADIAFSGLIADISNQKVDKINAKGYFNLNNFRMNSTTFKDVVEIPIAQMKITPSNLEVTNFVSKLGTNDLIITGNISNYLAYFLGKNEILKGNFNATSKSLNLNDFMTETSTKTSNEETNDAVKTGLIKVPENLDITFNLKANQLIYQQLDLKNVNGNLKIANQEVTLSNVLMEVFGGKINMGGMYNTSEDVAKTNINFGLDQLGIKESAATFEIFKTYAPILNNISGDFFSNFNINVDLNENMKPILKSINADGFFKTGEISSNGINVLKKIGGILKINELVNPNIDKFNASFSIKDGTLTLKPNEFKLNDMKAGISGTFDLEKNLNLVLTIDVPRAKLGTNFNNVINNLAGIGNKLDIGKDIGEIVKTKFLITGLANNPKIKPILMGSAGQTITETVTEVVENKVDAIKNDAMEKARVEGEKLINAAKEQKAQLMNEAEKLAQEVRDKAKQSGDDLLKNTQGNPLKQIAAQATADKMAKEADKKALQIIDVADKKGNDLINKAQIQADELLQNVSKK